MDADELRRLLCAYCQEQLGTERCWTEHDAWRGTCLCQDCYAAICAEPAVLPGAPRTQEDTPSGWTPAPQ